MRVCCHCRILQSAQQFQHFNGKPSGWCRDCRTEAAIAKRRADGIPEKELSAIKGGSKRCMACGSWKELCEFSNAKRGRGGVSAYCKSCFRVLYRPTREECRVSTAKYRAAHKERYRAKHRLTQLRRRTKIEAASDGTVTDVFLKKVYGTKTCAYCGGKTAVNQRTLDHITPLTKGGAHSALNITMACFTCNSSKRDSLWKPL